MMGVILFYMIWTMPKGVGFLGTNV